MRKVSEHSKIVKERITEYLQYDIDRLLYSTDAIVFGGAVRDSLVDRNINDVDIAVLPESRDLISERLINTGWKILKLDDEKTPQWVLNNYREVKYMFNPITFKKVVQMGCYAYSLYIQLINPKFESNSDSNIQGLKKFISSVDYSNCGVAYAFGDTIETIEGAIDDILNMRFRACEGNVMYSDRSKDRKIKFLERGWVFYSNDNKNSSITTAEMFWREEP